MLEDKSYLEKASIGALIITHGACFLTGVYKGAQNSRGLCVDMPMSYLYLANAVSTGIFVRTHNYKSFKQSVVSGAGYGAMATALELIVGYGIGYVGGPVIDRVLS